MASIPVRSLTIFLLVFVATVDRGGAKKSHASHCMSGLLQSYGIPAKRAVVYARRMARSKTDERSLQRYSTFPAYLHLHLATLGIKGKDRALLLACAHSGSGAKSHKCKNTPCGAHGTCMYSEKSQNRYVCDCKAGFTGQRCEKDLCSPNPCANKGVCYHNVRGFACDCKKGYIGHTCKKTINECKSSPCQNGGRCEDGVLKYTCNCPTGYKGVNCETKWLDVTEYEKLRETIKSQQVKIQTQEAKLQKQEAGFKKLQAEIHHLNVKPCTSSRGVVNWKQRSRDHLNSNKNHGQLMSMTYRKRRDDTHLRLTWTSTIQMQTGQRCNQWYFLIDSRECNNPAPVDGRIYQGRSNDIYRPSTIVGVCHGTSAGTIRSGFHHITMNVRHCKGFSSGSVYTGWDTNTNMLVEELCPPS